MTTPSNPKLPRPSGEHWIELSGTLPEEETEEFAEWVREELAILERELSHFMSPNSRRPRKRKWRRRG
jgi:hypothetical protein